jgi:hypothetical protein
MVKRWVTLIGHLTCHDRNGASRCAGQITDWVQCVTCRTAAGNRGHGRAIAYDLEPVTGRRHRFAENDLDIAVYIYILGAVGWVGADHCRWYIATSARSADDDILVGGCFVAAVEIGS